MTETLDLANIPDKITTLRDCMFKVRDRCGGMINHIIIPPAFKALMFNLKPEEGFDETQEFYHWGWYNEFRFTVYVDKTLTDAIYLMCNYKSAKIKVLNA